MTALEPVSWADLPMPDLRRLTTSEDKIRHYPHDPLLVEGWASVCRLSGDVGAYRFAEQTGLMWLRPDLVFSGGVERVLHRTEQAGFVPLAARPASLSRQGVRAMWWWQLRRATVERLLLLDAVAALGPGLLVLYGHPHGAVAERLTELKGGNIPAARAAGSLRTVAGSPNRILTMVHTSDDGADVVRELAAFLNWPQREEFLQQAQARRGRPLAGRRAVAEAVAALYASYPLNAHRQGPDEGREARVERLATDVRQPGVASRWAAICDWAKRVPAISAWTEPRVSQGGGELEPPVEGGGRAAVVDGGTGGVQGVGEGVVQVLATDTTVGGDRSGGVGQDRIAGRAVLSTKDTVDGRGVVGGIAAAQPLRARAGQAVAGGVQSAGGDAVRAGGPDGGGRGGGDLVEAVVAAHDEGPGAAVGEDGG
ncbi:hypothetical protein M4438_35505, partial [Streptomyces lavenduligriseus]